METVSIEFERFDGPAPFKDSVTLTFGELESLSSGDIDTMMMARFQAWVDIITTPGELDSENG